MRRFFISEMDGRAAALARARGFGLELIGFCDARKLEDGDFVAREAARTAAFPDLAVHAPYYEISPCAIDPLIGAVALHRMRQSAAVCRRLGTPRMIAHSGYAPQVYFPEWFIPKSVDFWSAFVEALPEGFELALENVLDPGPEALAAVCDGVDDPRLRICLDVGHVNAYSKLSAEVWIDALGARIRHVHLHNNTGARDAHAPLDCGSLDISRILKKLDECAPEADISIESVDAAACLRFLEDGGYIK